MQFALRMTRAFKASDIQRGLWALADKRSPEGSNVHYWAIGDVHTRGPPDRAGLQRDVLLVFLTLPFLVQGGVNCRLI